MSSARELILKNTKDIKNLKCLYSKIIEEISNTTGSSNSIVSIDFINIDSNGLLSITYTDKNGLQKIQTTSLEKFIIKYNVLNYTELLTNSPNLYDYAYVREEQGAKWLPGSLGGTYYPPGLYMWDGGSWINDDKYIINEINNILNTMSTVVSDSHVHTNKTLLDSYDQTNINITDAVIKKHAHSNKSILDNTTESFTTNILNSINACVSWINANGTALLSHLTNTSNPHNVTASQIGALTSETDPIFNASEAKLFVTGDKVKLDGIPTSFAPINAQQNVQADWNESNQSSDAYIKNKPTIPNTSSFATTTYVDNANSLKVDKITGKGLSTEDYTTTEKNKLASITEIFTTLLKTNYDNAVSWISLNGSNLINHLSNVNNPHNVTKSQVGLSNVVNLDTSTTANINDSINKRFVTDANLTNINNQSGTNTGDNAVNTLYSGLATSKENTIASGTTSQYYRGDKSWQTLDKSAVGLSSVDNTSDLDKPISSATQTALNNKADAIPNAIITHPTTTTETVVAKWSLPANSVSIGDSFGIKVGYQSGSTGTVAWKIRIGANGTTADTIVTTITTSAAQVANAYGFLEATVMVNTATTMQGNGKAQHVAVVLGTITGVIAKATINTANPIHISVTAVVSVANAGNKITSAYLGKN